MKSYLFGAVSVLSLIAASSASAHENDEGWYLRGNAGYGIHHDMDASGLIDSSAHGNGLQSEGDAGYTLGGGYDFGDHWRVELDADTLETSFGSISQTPSSKASLSTDSLMLNAIYDFDDYGKFEPYIGAGIGFVDSKARLSAHDFAGVAGELVRNPTCVGARTIGDPSSCEISDSDSGVGWQILAGLGYKISDNLTWDTHYTYLNAPDLDLEGHIANTTTGAFSFADAALDDVGAHTVMTGLRYTFGGAPVSLPQVERAMPTADFKCWDGSMVFNSGQCAAQVVEPRVVEAQPAVRCWDGSMVFDRGQCPVQTSVTCPDGSIVSDINFCPRVTAPVVVSGCGEQFRSEVIYYEFDKGASAETRNTITRALDAGEFCSVSGIRVVGHTDTSGAASYNLALSKRRADDALSELVRQGVSRNTIVAEGKGETENVVQTGDGVKEQLNRRTEVLITLGSATGFTN